MKVPFTKASACGNDFLIIDGVHAPTDLHDFSRRICDRHNGVGADGVEWLFPAPDADMRARLINADGSEAEISGNGTRCVAAYMVSNGHAGKLAIRTGAGVKHCELVAREGHRLEFEMEMGEPRVDDAFSITVAFGQVHGTPVSMGNPHYVVFVKEFVRVQGANDVEVRFFERGVGETQSSGTGSCASAVAAIAAGAVSSPVKVHAQGGTQVVRWTGRSVFLRGPAQLICQGDFLG
jgi:diaminopimelate epimerase